MKICIIVSALALIAAAKWLSLLFLFLLSDCIAGFLGFAILWRLRNNPFIRCLMIAYLCVGLDGLMFLVGLLDGPRGCNYPLWYVGWASMGRLLRTSAIWGTVIFISALGRRSDAK